MTFKLVLLLVACLLVVTGWADDNSGNFDIALTGEDLEGHLSIEDWYKLNEDVDLAGTKIYRRAVATVTVTETVCGPVASDGPTNPSGESAPFVSIPETTLVTATGTEPAPAPTTETAPAASGTGSAPSDAEPTGIEPTGVEPTSDGPSSDGPTTTHHHTSSSTSGESTSADEPEAPTQTSDGPSASAEPTLNAGFRQGGTSSLALAFALTFVRFFGV
ncbi:hypothetical protein BDV19DRAFT_74815 [Aspergillus venezuelensis]